MYTIALVEVDVKLVTGNNGDEVSWKLGECESNISLYASNKSFQSFHQTCYLKEFTNDLLCKDEGRNTWEGGYLVINNKKYCDDSSWPENSATKDYSIEFGSKYILFKINIESCILHQTFSSLKIV